MEVGVEVVVVLQVVRPTDEVCCGHSYEGCKKSCHMADCLGLTRTNLSCPLLMHQNKFVVSVTDPPEQVCHVSY